MPIDARGRKRDYKKEYKRDHASSGAKKDRASRNQARASMVKIGAVSKGDGKEVDHKKPLSKGGGTGKTNLRVVSRATNRKKATK